MDDTTDEMLLESFTEAVGGMAQTVDSLAGLAKQNAVAAVPQPLANTASPDANSGSDSSSSSSTSSGGASDVLTIAATVLESGLGVVPLMAGLIGLFTGGGDDATPPPLVKYAMPAKQQFQAADTGSDISEADYDQTGMPRVYNDVAGATSADNSPGGALRNSGSNSGVPQIQVNVQAMDAQSFLDHSSEIAQAVRTAMLNLSSINDVVSDL